MLASITGIPVYRGTSNVLDSLVRRAVALVVDTELRSNVEFYGQHRLGAHLERYLVDALRRLVAAGDWTVNGQSSPVWHGADGMRGATLARTREASAGARDAARGSGS